MVATYRYRLAPEGLLTRRQLRAAGLRPVGDPVAEIVWRRGRRVAYLYEAATAVPVQPMTPGRWRAHEAMMRARRICTTCGQDAGYVLRRSTNTCEPCHQADPADVTEVAA
ncbi:RRQRL motif-containing zinc-binding protein [Streptomyces sp. NPDC006638]|uniref:RRQRL motif-containing zinc-binding protein n=1 Tax=Streptomyces sp. NPDC006638 TaxID=3157183 RepID=UPI0033A7E867